MPLSADEVVARLDELPPLSDTATRLSEAIGRPSCTVDTLVTIIEGDALLAQRVLKLANSAYYSVPGGVASIKKAVSFIGFSSVHQIALVVSSLAILTKRNPIPPHVLKHASAVATLSRALAHERALAKKDMAVAAGLLHDLGWLALHALMPDVCKQYVAAVAGGAAHGAALELQHFALTHADVGARLAAKWSFPPTLVTLVSEHHGPGAPTPADEAVEQLTDVVSLADTWAWQLGRPGLALPAGVTVPAALPPTRLLRLKLQNAALPEERRAPLLKLIEQEPSIA